MDRRCSSPPVEPSARRIRPSEPPRQQVLAQRGSAGGGNALNPSSRTGPHCHPGHLSSPTQRSIPFQAPRPRSVSKSATKRLTPLKRARQNRGIMRFHASRSGSAAAFVADSDNRPSHRRLTTRPYATRRGGRALRGVPRAPGPAGQVTGQCSRVLRPLDQCFDPSRCTAQGEGAKYAAQQGRTAVDERRHPADRDTRDTMVTP